MKIAASKLHRNTEQIAKDCSQGCSDGKQRCYLAALKPGGQRQNCQDKFQRPVICIYLFPMKYRFHQIRSKAAIPSAVQKQEQNAKDNTADF